MREAPALLSNSALSVSELGRPRSPRYSCRTRLSLRRMSGTLQPINTVLRKARDTLRGIFNFGRWAVLNIRGKGDYEKDAADLLHGLCQVG